jgi:hypothetical protein
VTPPPELADAEQFVRLAVVYAVQAAASRERPPPAEGPLLELAARLAPEPAEPAARVELAGRRVLEALALLAPGA